MSNRVKLWMGELKRSGFVLPLMDVAAGAELSAVTMIGAIINSKTPRGDSMIDSRRSMTAANNNCSVLF